MLIREFPDIHWLKQQIQTRFENRRRWDGLKLATNGWPTVLLNAKANNLVRDQVVGPLSIFTNLAGKSKAFAGKRDVEVSQDVFFLSNVNEPYTLIMSQPVETFNIHIGEQISKEIFYALSKSHAHLIDNPSEEKELPAFHNRLQWRDQKFNSILAELIEGPNELRENECMAELLLYLLQSHQQIDQTTSSLESSKKSTREEIAKRLMIAADYIYAHFGHDISLDELAAVSCLSKFHLLRLFKAFYGASPHQFINQVRIEKAKSLLKFKKGTIKEIGCRVGFADASSFSRSFHQHTGFYPTAFSA